MPIAGTTVMLRDTNKLLLIVNQTPELPKSSVVNYQIVGQIILG